MSAPETPSRKPLPESPSPKPVPAVRPRSPSPKACLRVVPESPFPKVRPRKLVPALSPKFVPAGACLQVRFRRCVKGRRFSAACVGHEIKIHNRTPFRDPDYGSDIVASRGVGTAPPLLLVGFGRQHHVHLLAVELGHHLHFGDLFEVGGEAEQQDFALLLEDDRTAAEEDVRLDLAPLL